MNLSHVELRQYNYDLYNSQACVSITNCGPNLSMLDYGFNYPNFDEMNAIYQIPPSNQLLVSICFVHIYNYVVIYFKILFINICSFNVSSLLLLHFIKYK